MTKADELEGLFTEYKRLRIDQQIDYDKFYLYSIITHSTAIEGSTVTEIENQLLFDQGITASGRTITEQMMNLDLKAAYEKSLEYVSTNSNVTIDILKELSAIVMKNTGSTYKTALGEFSSANGDLRLLNVTAGIGGHSYMSYTKVPSKLKEFCDNLNEQRKMVGRNSVAEKYIMSFDAHYNLVTIHPWADGNGRMARLVMNMLQFENWLIPAKILKEDKAEYIKTLVETRTKDDLSLFRNFMMGIMIKNLKGDIQAFKESTEFHPARTIKKEKSREKILEFLSKNNKMTTAMLAAEVGISSKAIEKHLANLKKEGLLKRIGPDKGGHWDVGDFHNLNKDK